MVPHGQSSDKTTSSQKPKDVCDLFVLCSKRCKHSLGIEFEKAGFGAKPIEVHKINCLLDANPTSRHMIVFLARRLDDSEKAIFMDYILNGYVPVVVSPELRNDAFIRSCKVVSNARGNLFELPHNHSSVAEYLRTVCETMLYRHTMDNRFHENRFIAFQRRFCPAQFKTGDEVPQTIKAATDILRCLPGVHQATASLRSDRGRINADKILELYDLTRNDIAHLAGLSAEAVRQTPDSDRLQEVLDPYEKVARMLTLNQDPKDFRSWLRIENAELSGRKPLNLLLEGKGATVANLVESILLGIPD